jgi:hypothetical protein
MVALMPGRAERAEHQGHPVLLDQAAGMLHGLGWAVAVVEGDEGEPSAVDAAIVIQHFDVGRLGLAHLRQRRCGAAVRHDVADPDFLVAGVGDRRHGQGRYGGE